MMYIRSVAVWLVIILAESVHGFLRGMFLTPLLGDLLARQVSVFTGSLIIFTITYLFIRWIRAKEKNQLLGIGLIWLVLTVAFEVALGRLAFHYPWEKILADYNLLKGGLMPFGLVFLMLSPWLAARIRKLI